MVGRAYLLMLVVGGGVARGMGAGEGGRGGGWREKAPAARPEGGYVERVRARAQEVEGYGVAIGHAVLSGSAILNGLTDLNGLISFVWAFQRDNKIINPKHDALEITDHR